MRERQHEEGRVAMEQKSMDATKQEKRFDVFAIMSEERKTGKRDLYELHLVGENADKMAKFLNTDDGMTCSYTVHKMPMFR